MKRTLEYSVGIHVLDSSLNPILQSVTAPATTMKPSQAPSLTTQLNCYSLMVMPLIQIVKVIPI